MHVAVIGSGPSGVHFALTALGMGARVTMIDVGRTGLPAPLPAHDVVALKDTLAAPVPYFLGEDYAAIELPAGTEASGIYGFPASKDHVFAPPPAGFPVRTEGIRPLVSFAAGGLAECWTAGAYPFTDADLADFPISAAELWPHYETVAERIGIGGAEDDLAPFLPGHRGLLPPIELDESSARLLDRHERNRARLRRRHPGAYFGRSRQAALARRLGDRPPCQRCGRCLWGCPTGALYTPSLSLAQCRGHPRFRYLGGRFASYLAVSGGDEIGAVELVTPAGPERVTADLYVLACGTIGSANLVLRTFHRARGEAPVLRGLMDNRQVLAPFLHLAMLGRPYSAAEYQYHQLALGLEAGDPAAYVHGQITTLTAATAHPLIQQLPVGFGPARGLFAALRSALGVVNLNFADTRRTGNTVALAPDSADADGWPALALSYAPPAGEAAAIAAALRRLRRLFLDLGAPLIPGMTQVRPMGSSVHYTGTLPMSADRRELTVSPDCRSHDFGNLLVVDGSVFPSLPAKNLTFTLMANATRAARAAL